MRISVGIFAHNSAATIRETVQSLSGQDLVAAPPPGVEFLEIWCVANGCTDSTAEAAERAFDVCRRESNSGRVTCGVVQIPVAGKSNAWNEFVHRVSDPRADVLVCMDSDVVLLDSGAVSGLIAALRQDAEAILAAGSPVKDLESKESPGFWDRISLAASRFNRATRPTSVAGCLYAIRGPFARSCWLPVGLQVDDGFLHALVKTDQFRSEGSPSRVRPVPEARVRFEAYTRPSEILRHEVRLLEGSVVNSYLYTYMWASSGPGGVGELIREHNERNPRWVAECAEREIRARGWWVVPRGFLVWRLSALRRLPWVRALKLVPIALVRTAVDWCVAVIVNRRLRGGRWGAWR